MVDQRSSRVLPFFFFFFLFYFFALLGLTFEQQLSSQLEFKALFELRSSLGLRSKEWPRKTDPCLWNGVVCEDGRVVSLNISGFRRTRLGRQNPQFSVNGLANLTFLRSFNASNFLLPGTIPEWFGSRLNSLRVLDLRSCSIYGSLPYSLGNLTNLTGLYLSRNNLSGSIPSFTNLKNLSFFDLSSNFLSGSIPPGIGTLSRLQALNLSSNNLSGSIPAILGDLGALVDLDLSFNSFSGSVPPELRGLRSLKKLLIGNNLLSGSLPDNFFSNPSSLETIVLNRNSFNGGIPSVVWSAPRLRFLDVSGNNFTGQLPNSSLSDNATVDRVLNMSGNLFYGRLSTVLRQFGSVDLSGNYFQGGVPDYVVANASLDSNCLQNLRNQRNLSDCESFYAERGQNFDAPSPAPSPAAERETSKKSNRRTIILAAVLGGVGLILLLAILLVLVLVCLRKRGDTTQRGVGVGPVPGSSSPPPAVTINYSSVGDAFTYQQLLQATSDFSDANLIKNGHSGDLFRGVLESGIPVVIKRIDLRSVKKEAHLVELDFFGKASHTRFVPFLGHCLENDNEKFLVYKYMPNGDLSSSLYKKNNTEDDGLQSLDWITRLKIALGVAEGLSYLHHECNPPLVHRDVQASSILLDDKFEVRLGSLSEVCTQEGDIHQSKITRLLRLPQSSEQGASGTPTAVCAYDVYCLGKVLLELVTGKLGISASSDARAKEWLDQTVPYISIYDKELVTKIVDPSLIVDDDLLEEVWAMAVVARSCLNPKPSRRPPMRYILKALENPLKVVREENSGSARLRTTSSRGSWNAALFGSWRSSSDITVIPAVSSAKVEGGSGLKHSGTTGSQGSGQNGGGGEHSSSHRRHSREIFPEPSSVQDVERPDQD